MWLAVYLSLESTHTTLVWHDVARRDGDVRDITRMVSRSSNSSTKEIYKPLKYLFTFHCFGLFCSMKMPVLLPPSLSDKVPISFPDDKDDGDVSDQLSDYTDSTEELSTDSLPRM